MPFLTRIELSSTFPATFIDALIDALSDADETVVDTLIRENVSLMKEYLQGYDTEAAFAAQGDERNDTLLHYLNALVVYDLCARYTRQSINETIALGREEAMRWLERVAQGQLAVNLPAIDRDKDGKDDPPYSMGSQPRYHTYF